MQTVELTSSPAATAPAAVATAPVAPPPDVADFFSWPLLVGICGVAAVLSYVRRRRREVREEVTGGDG